MISATEMGSETASNFLRLTSLLDTSHLGFMLVDWTRSLVAKAASSRLRPQWMSAPGAASRAGANDGNWPISEADRLLASCHSIHAAAQRCKSGLCLSSAALYVGESVDSRS
jgi:hypothetical protein